MDMSVKLSVSATELCWILRLSREIMFFWLRLSFVLGWVDVHGVLAIAVPNRSQQFAVGPEFTGSGKKKNTNPSFTSSFCLTLCMWIIHAIYPRVIWIHLALNQCLQRRACTVPSSFSQFTALPFVVSLINSWHEGNSNSFSNTLEGTAAIAF